MCAFLSNICTFVTVKGADGSAVSSHEELTVKFIDMQLILTFLLLSLML